MKQILDRSFESKNEHHTLDSFYFIASRLLERASFYGLRAVIVVYMIDGILKMDRTEALSVYAIYSGLLIVFQISGAIIGDLILGNKKAKILGGIIQSIGAFILCIESTTALYFGLGLVLLGGGMYSPNLLANFGKEYLNKAKLLDAGFTILYLAAIIGATIGVVLIGTIGEKFGFIAAFVILGITMLSSVLPLFPIKTGNQDFKIETSKSTRQKFLLILFALFLVGIFWNIYEILHSKMYEFQFELSEISPLNISGNLWSSIDQLILIPIGIIICFLWSYYFNSQFFKLMMGFIFGAISYCIFFIIPEIASEYHAILYLTSITFLGVSEIFISPVVYSLLTIYSNPKYLAIFISLTKIPTKLFIYFTGFYNELLYSDQTNPVLFCVIFMFILSGVLFVYNRKN